MFKKYLKNWFTMVLKQTGGRDTQRRNNLGD